VDPAEAPRPRLDRRKFLARSTGAVAGASGWVALALDADAQERRVAETPAARAFEADELQKRLADSGRSYLEFLRVPSMNLGVYRLAAGATDGQSPHAQDEIYHVLSGKAVLRVGEERIPVRAGSIVFVRARETHRFEAIEEDLAVLVVFAGAPLTDLPRTEPR
jgi:mannose-6-phosphate isomerase-like protein (cupin superfamily)